jgi:hypothetical protein
VSPLELVDGRFDKLATELRAARPSVSERLRQRVEVLARAEPEEREQRFRPRIMWGRSAKRLVVVCAVVAVAIPLVGAGVQGLHDGANPQPAEQFAGRNPAIGAPAETGKATTDRALPQSAQKRLRAALAPTATRLQQYDATVGIRVRNVDALSDATKRAMSITRRLGGYVAAARYSTKAGQRGGANLVVKIPSAKVPVAVERFSALGTITRQRVSILDVQRRADRQTKSIAFLERDLQRVERLLASGGLSSDRRAQLEHEAEADKLALKTVRRDHRTLVRRAQLARVELVLRTGTESAAAGRFQRTLDDAGATLVRELELLFYALIVAGPLLLLGGIAIAVGRAQRRRSDRRLLERT